MNSSSRLGRVCSFLLALVLLVGCSPRAEDQDLMLTIDGEGCKYAGPEEVREGKVIIVLDNPTGDQFVHMHVSKLDEGKTWQDYVELIGGLDDVTPAPAPWVRPINPTSVDGETGSVTLQTRYFREWEFSLTSGLHTINCSRHAGVVDDVPNDFWPAAPLEVRP